MDGPATLISKVRNGTLLFDEVADLSEEAQARIVRMLDSFNDGGPRIMATSQADLAAKLDKGAFRQDLFYRLSGVTLNVPSLRERVEDKRGPAPVVDRRRRGGVAIRG
jgi:two-component system nitrogen regulation response regulator GlnG